MNQQGNLVVFKTDKGFTLSFKERIYFIGNSEPFYQIAKKSLARNDYVPFYVEIAKREGIGSEFRDNLISELKNYSDQFVDDLLNDE
jgi:hypothetical protein